MARFAVQWVFNDNTEVRLKVRPTHREYLRQLADRGLLLGAGPWDTDDGALLIYEVTDRAQLGELLAADPYTAAEVIAETRVREWNLVLGPWAES
ncbi:hypothetical protein GCM10012275_19910 [Longimycelium tulufanense]|uniref:YCII-related domain-containing protein n=1 Tax=Longimycelium tulufanense TaxID=907463 RepID=A0A8J3FV50_9PSEU|nr:YciI family protein [Longimycelium tulufanense]GGM49021.1 hypothetical protein GCM10012275_19910 [Longimycelium tulufanense]